MKRLLLFFIFLVIAICLDNHEKDITYLNQCNKHHYNVTRSLRVQFTSVIKENKRLKLENALLRGQPNGTHIYNH